VQTFPAGSPQEERVEAQRVLGAIQAVNSCLPQPPDPNDSGTAAATAGLINGCTTLSGALSVFVLQMQTFACWVWAQLQAIYTLITNLQTQVNNIKGVRTPGAVTITPQAGLGVGATASIVGNDTAGQITLHTGTGNTSGLQFTLAFLTPYATAGILHLEEVDSGSQSFVPESGSTTTVSGSSVSALNGIGDNQTAVMNYVVLGGT